MWFEIDIWAFYADNTKKYNGYVSEFGECQHCFVETINIKHYVELKEFVNIDGTLDILWMTN